MMTDYAKLRAESLKGMRREAQKLFSDLWDYLCPSCGKYPHSALESCASSLDELAGNLPTSRMQLEARDIERIVSNVAREMKGVVPRFVALYEQWEKFKPGQKTAFDAAFAAHRPQRRQTTSDEHCGTCVHATMQCRWCALHGEHTRPGDTCSDWTAQTHVARSPKHDGDGTAASEPTASAAVASVKSGAPVTRTSVASKDRTRKNKAKNTKAKGQHKPNSRKAKSKESK